MATSQMSGFIQRLRRVLRDGAGLTDGQLLADYLSRRDEAAIAALVRRHGPMVWGVCRRVLRDHHDAEDAFQTTFLVLVRKAASIASRELLANWLYGVAHQTALKARATAVKRKGRERPMTETQEPAVREEAVWRDLHPLLDEELSRMPAKYRSIIVMCDLEGKTRKQVAEHLGCPEGTVASRLARARVMLAKRLTRQGVALSSGVLAAVLAQQAASAGVPTSVAASAIKAASLLAAGKAAATGAISVKVAALTEGVLKTMLLTKLKSVMAMLVIAAMVGLIGYGIARGQQKGDAPQKESEPKIQKAEDAAVKEKAEKKETTAWGKEIDGLQMGLEGAHTVRQGEKARFTVKLRNVGKADVKVTHGLLKEWPPEVSTADGGKVSVFMPIRKGYKVRVTELTNKPGETITLYEPEVAVEPEALMRLEGIMRVDTPTICVDPGKYKIAFGGMIQSHPKLSTGIVEFEVKEAAKPVEAFTAWGKEAGGLQAGLGFRPGERRAYHHGETVTLVVRVRNVGKETVKFSYIQPCIERTMLVTDGDGKAIYQPVVIPGDLGYTPEVAELSPGKEIDLYELKRQLRPASEGRSKIVDKQPPYALYGTGNVQVQYDKLVPQPTDKILGNIVTGKLELEIKPEAAPKDDNEANKAVNPRVSIDKTKATVEGQLDEASTLVLRIGEEKDKLFWEARRKDTPGSAMVRFSEEGAKRFWGDKAQSAGAFKAVVELSDKILMSDGKFATGFIYSVAICEGAATEKQNLIGSMIYVPIPKTGTLQDFLARSLAGDAMPFGQLSLREESKIVRKDGVVTFADIQKGDGTLVPVSFVIEKSHSSLRRKQP